MSQMNKLYSFFSVTLIEITWKNFSLVENAWNFYFRLLSLVLQHDIEKV